MKEFLLVIFYLNIIFILAACNGDDDIKILQKQNIEKLDFRGAKIIAHRGFWNVRGSAQNSLASIVNAKELGVHGVELDLRISADFILYLAHDSSINGLKIIETKSEILDKVLLKNGEPLPRLTKTLNLLKNYKDFEVHLDLKNDVKHNLQKPLITVINEVKKVGIEKNVALIAFDINYLKQSKQINSEIKTYGI